MEIYVVAIDSLQELRKHPKFNTDMFELKIDSKTDKEFGKHSNPVAVPYKIWQEILKDQPEEEYDPWENNFDNMV